jgi:hypothetical protein
MTGTDGWRRVDDSLQVWFDAPDHATGAALVTRVAGLDAAGDDAPDVDLRASGVRFTLRGNDAAAEAISAAAAELGLQPDPSVLQAMRVVVEAGEPAAVRDLWRTVLGYDDAGGDLVDPSRRDASFRVVHTDDLGRLRNRLHVDVARPHARTAATVEALPGLGGSVLRSGEWHAAVADAEGNEIDLVPMSPDGSLDGPGTDDWWALFGAMASYPTTDRRTAAALAEQVARLADDAGLPLLVDLRPDAVVVDSGKDQWEDAAFPDLARGVQAAARELGLTGDTSGLRFVQVAIDAVDVVAVREFWRVALGYVADTREGLTDLFDPRRLTMPVFFQPTDAGETGRLRQRDRLHLELSVPDDQVQRRLDLALAAGGSLVGADPGGGRWTVTDPEGNELVLTTG